MNSRNQSEQFINDVSNDRTNSGAFGRGGGSSSGGNRRIYVYTTYYYYIKIVDENEDPITSGVSITWNSGRGNSVPQTNLSSSTGIYQYSIVQNDETTAPVSFSCSVASIGYQSTTCSVTRTEQISNYTPTLVQLSPVTGYYCDLFIKDTSNNYASILNADISVYSDSSMTNLIPSSSYTLTVSSRDGRHIFEFGQSGPLYIKVEKNGYNTETITINTSTTARGSYHTPYTVALSPGSNANYYYVVKAVDTNNDPVSNVIFEIYNDLALSRPRFTDTLPISSPDAREAVFKRLKSVISTQYGVAESRIKLSDDFVKDYGGDSLDALELATTIERAAFCVTIPPESFGDIITVEDLLDFIQNNADSTNTIAVTRTFNTDSNGLYVEQLEERSTAPNPVYLNVVSVPNTYSKEGLQVTKILPTLSDDIPGAIITLSPKIGTETKYYNVFIVDGNTEQPVQDATVKYILNDTVLSTQTSNSNGLVYFDYNTPSLYVSVYKEEYNDFGYVEVTGFDASDGCVKIPVFPKNSIRVIYDDDNEPAANMMVCIYGYNDKTRVNYLTLKTYESGYVDTLDNSFYSSGTKFVTVTNYDVEDKSLITKVLHTGLVEIRLPYIYDGSDYDDGEYHFEKFNDMSINNIKKIVRKGNYEIKTNGSSNKVSYTGDGFRINILDPDTITTYDIFESSPVMMYNNQKSVVGSVNVCLKSDVNKLGLKLINRYSGYYNPIFKDILFYYNFETVKDGDRFICPYSNTAFDYNYKDKYGKFGVINNMWFHKANDNKDIDIITSLNPYFPLTGQYALDYRDYNIFSSNWDMNYYTKQVDVDHSEPLKNIASMKDTICMFGSKYLNVPETIEICGFRLGNETVVWNGEWNDDWITNPDGCPGEMMYKEVNDTSVDFYFFFRKRILRYFREKLKEEFEKYIAENEFSFGKDGLDDDIDEYVSKNVLKLYKLDKVRMFVRRIKVGQHNSKIENNYTDYLEYDPDDGRFCDVGYFRRQNFNDVININLVKMNRDDFDRKIVYNLRTGTREEFGFSFILRKI